jgi:hypothetical protein
MLIRGRRDRDRMVVGFISTYAISAYHHNSCELESRSRRGVLDIFQLPYDHDHDGPLLTSSSIHKLVIIKVACVQTFNHIYV